MANFGDQKRQDVALSASKPVAGAGLLLIPVLWLVVAGLATTVAAAASERYPVSSLEQQIAAWPPRLNSADYLKRVLVEPFFRWDPLYHFLRIVTQGYRPNSAVLAFYPLYPTLARVVYSLGVDPAVSLLLLSWFCGLGYLFIFRRLAALDLSPDQATWATLLLLVFPMSLVLYLPYMESMFLSFAALALYLARLKHWLGAGLAVMLATLTKQPGILLLLPLAYELAADRSPHGPGFRKRAGRWFVLGLAPLAMILWTLFRTLAFDPGFVFAGSIPHMALQTLVSSSASEMVVSRPFAWPWQIIADAASAATTVPTVRMNVLFNLSGYFLIVLLLAASWKYLRPSYRVYVLCLLISTLFDYSFDANAQPLTSMFRHAYLAFPVFIFAPALERGKLGRLAYAALGIAGFIVLLYAYVMNAWIV